MIQFTENDKKLEDIKPDIETSFEVGITSDVETFIRTIRVSCGCVTNPVLVGNPIKPGTTSILKVSFTPVGTGYHSKSIWLGYLENGEDKEAKFSFTANIK